LRSFDDALPGLEELKRAFSPVFRQHVDVLGPSIELRFPAPSCYGGTCGGGGNGPCFIDGALLWGKSMRVLAPSVCLRGLPQMRGIQVEPGISAERTISTNIRKPGGIHWRSLMFHFTLSRSAAQQTGTFLLRASALGRSRCDDWCRHCCARSPRNLEAPVRGMAAKPIEARRCFGSAAMMRTRLCPLLAQSGLTGRGAITSATDPKRTSAPTVVSRDCPLASPCFDLAQPIEPPTD
jgi:hypothetical protein